ncbi:MAG TPA: nuclear transport factor 2 family protein [Xanthomonadales bacterium]|nr:nuclear transport factor 2 family protein [Xanthomonadales bacterium]
MIGNLAFLAFAAVATPAVANDVSDILAAERALCAAFEAGDADGVLRGVTADFTLVDSRGAVTTGVQEADSLRGAVDYMVFRNEGTKVRLHGDAAIATGVTHVRGRAGTDEFSGAFRFTDTWVRQNGRWLLAASHASRLPEPSQP